MFKGNRRLYYISLFWIGFQNKEFNGESTKSEDVDKIQGAAIYRERQDKTGKAK